MASAAILQWPVKQSNGEQGLGGRRTRIHARAGAHAGALTNVTCASNKRDDASRGVLRSHGIAMVPGYGAAFRLQHAQRPGRLPCNEKSQGKRLRSCGTGLTIDARGPALTPTTHLVKRTDGKGLKLGRSLCHRRGPEDLLQRDVRQRRALDANDHFRRKLRTNPKAGVREGEGTRPANNTATLLLGSTAAAPVVVFRSETY